MDVHRPRVFLDVSADQDPLGRLTIELFTDKTPRTCENFRQLCTGEHNGLSYAKAPFHRVIDEFMVQGGDIANGDGTGVTSIYGDEFDDENLDWRELDAAGLVCSANRGKDTNGSQFFITLEPCTHLNGKHTIFGRLISGQDVLERVAKAEVDAKDVPLVPILVARCGELERKKKRSEPAAHPTRPVQKSDDRGRTRRSDASEKEAEVQGRRNVIGSQTRRQSDNVVDEGLRGRPRARSRRRSRSRAISSESPSYSRDRSHASSEVSKHKRKRSVSPSRHGDDHYSDEHENRRRRSLPNQYHRDQHHRFREDDRRYRPDSRYRSRDDRNLTRRNDNYHPSRRRYGDQDRGRLTAPDEDSTNDRHRYDRGDEAPIKFKGRGFMKYRENHREVGRL